jgi:hypothetical protein
MTPMLDKDMIRSLIRDVIAEEVQHLKTGTSAPPASVSIDGDADLAAFAREVLRLAEDPKIRAAIVEGRQPFRLARLASTPARQNAAAGGQNHRIDVGVVTEAIIAKLPADAKRLQLGPGVSITPLARDRARSRSISVERIKQ